MKSFKNYLINEVSSRVDLTDPNAKAQFERDRRIANTPGGAVRLANQQKMQASKDAQASNSQDSGNSQIDALEKIIARGEMELTGHKSKLAKLKQATR